MSTKHPELTPEERRKFYEFMSVVASDEQFIEKMVEKLAHSDVAVNAFENVARQSRERAGHSEEVTGLVHLLAARSGDTHEDVLLKALTLYGLAFDAIEKGNFLAILNSEDEIVREITGFETAEAEGRPVAR